MPDRCRSHESATPTWQNFYWILLREMSLTLNTLGPRQDGRRFPDDIFKWIFLNEIIWISIKISLKFAPMGPINNIPALVQIMAWRRPGDKPLSEAMMVSLLTHKCVTRPQWVNRHLFIIMACHRRDNEPLSKPIMIQFIDAYMSLGPKELSGIGYFPCQIRQIWCTADIHYHGNGISWINVVDPSRRYFKDAKKCIFEYLQC